MTAREPEQTVVQDPDTKRRQIVSNSIHNWAAGGIDDGHDPKKMDIQITALREPFFGALFDGIPLDLDSFSAYSIAATNILKQEILPRLEKLQKRYVASFVSAERTFDNTQAKSKKRGREEEGLDYNETQHFVLGRWRDKRRRIESAIDSGRQAMATLSQFIPLEPQVEPQNTQILPSASEISKSQPTRSLGFN